MEIEELIKKLNRLYGLYGIATATAKPYRINKIRKAYTFMFEMASIEYDVITLNSQTEYEMLLGRAVPAALLELIQRKHTAIEQGNYETAAALRDQEKVRLELVLQQNGYNKDDHFFKGNKNQIFFKQW